jgi:hypothetical protein
VTRTCPGARWPFRASLKNCRQGGVSRNPRKFRRRPDPAASPRRRSVWLDKHEGQASPTRPFWSAPCSPPQAGDRHTCMPAQAIGGRPYFWKRSLRASPSNACTDDSRSRASCRSWRPTAGSKCPEIARFPDRLGGTGVARPGVPGVTAGTATGFPAAMFSASARLGFLMIKSRV